MAEKPLFLVSASQTFLTEAVDNIPSLPVWVGKNLCNGMKVVLKAAWPHAMQGFIGHNQHRELDLEANWNPM